MIIHNNPLTIGRKVAISGVIMSSNIKIQVYWLLIVYQWLLLAVNNIKESILQKVYKLIIQIL